MTQDNLKIIYKHFKENPIVSTDSRHIQPGSLFFALKGPSFNGNKFAGTALEHGASWAIIDEPEARINDRFILVEDVLTSLQELAKHHREKFNIPVIAITGTNGKTTTKELINTILSKRFHVAANTGNLNNHIGVPMTLLTMNQETEIAVIEMGANHPGEIEFLCHIAKPDFGLITNIGKAHLEGFGSFEGVIRSKTELYRYLQNNRGKIFINHDDTLLMDQRNDLPTISYGTPPASLSYRSLAADPFVSLDLLFEDHSLLSITSKLYGKYNASNILAAACIGQHLGVKPSLIKNAIEHYEPSNNRSQVARTSRNLLIMDAYNANPTSMKEALETFAGASFPVKTLILGDMLELGNESDKEHEAILHLLERMQLQAAYLIGPLFTRLNRKREFHCFQDVDLARMWFKHHPIKDSAILLKGSRGMKIEKLIDLL